MRRLALAPSAKADLAEVAAYSRRTWGKDRTAGHLGEIAGRIGRLRRRPLASRSRDEIYPGLRSARSSQHLVFFLFDEEKLIVVRVLHEKVDAPARLLRAIRQISQQNMR